MIRLIIVGLIGMFMILRPDIFWKLECFFKIKSGQPTIWYARMLRIGGVCFVAVSIGMLAYILDVR